jgi:hypothetical protein
MSRDLLQVTLRPTCVEELLQVQCRQEQLEWKHQWPCLRSRLSGHLQERMDHQQPHTEAQLLQCRQQATCHWHPQLQQIHMEELMRPVQCRRWQTQVLEVTGHSRHLARSAMNPLAQEICCLQKT